MCLRPPTPPKEMPTSTIINVNLLINPFVYRKISAHLFIINLIINKSKLFIDGKKNIYEYFLNLYIYIYFIFLFLNAIGRVLSACNSRLDIANVFVLWILFVFCPTKYVGPSRHERSNWEGNPHGENLQPSRPPLIQSGTCMGCWKVRPFSQLKSSRSSQPAINSITVTLGYPHTHTQNTWLPRCKKKRHLPFDLDIS